MIVCSIINRAIIKGVLENIKSNEIEVDKVNKIIKAKISLSKIVVLGTTEKSSFFWVFGEFCFSLQD